MFYMKVLFDHVKDNDNTVQGWRAHAPKVEHDLPEFAALERAAYDTIHQVMERIQQSQEGKQIIDWNAAMLTLARMYYLFYTGLGPKSEGGNDHLQYHANFSAMIEKEILPEFYSAKDFKAQCEREMLLGLLDGVTDI